MSDTLFDYEIVGFNETVVSTGRILQVARVFSKSSLGIDAPVLEVRSHMLNGKISNNKQLVWVRRFSEADGRVQRMRDFMDGFVWARDHAEGG